MTIAVAAFLPAYRLVPIPIGVVGIIFLFYGSILMLRETRMATATVNAEMDFTWQLAREVAPHDVISKYKRHVPRKKERPKPKFLNLYRTGELKRSG